MASGPLTRKFERVLEDLSSSETLLVAFSGGVDSALLLAAARRALGDGALAATAVSPLFPQRERRAAAAFCRDEHIHQIEFPFEILDSALFRDNGHDRCYHCKKALCLQLLDIAASRGIARVAHGANADDASDYRPGLQAAGETGVAAPLLEAGLSKDEIRALTRDLGLSVWDRPARACLASRIPYGEPVTPGKVEQIDRAEAFLEEAGFRQVRVRHHGRVARVEVPGPEIERFMDPGLRRAVVSALREAGFIHVALDLDGFVSGGMNRDMEGPWPSKDE